MPRIVQGGVITEGLRKEFRDSRQHSGLMRRGEDKEVKLEEIYLARYQKSWEELEKARF